MCLSKMYDKALWPEMEERLKAQGGTAYRIVFKRYARWGSVYKDARYPFNRWQKARTVTVLTEMGGGTYRSGWHVFWSEQDAVRFWYGYMDCPGGRDDKGAYGLAEVKVRGGMQFGYQDVKRSTIWRPVPVIVAPEQKLVRILRTNHKRHERLSSADPEK